MKIILSLIVTLCILAILPDVIFGGRAFNPHFDLRKKPKFQLSIDYALKQNRHSSKGVEYQWFTQELDHFDQQNTKTFQQRYLINDQYWDGKGPVFIMINGEGPMTIGTVLGLKYIDWAKQFNALVVALEHRYYGASFATPDISTENLQYLSSDQASKNIQRLILIISFFRLADNAVFRQFIAKQYNVTSSSKWVSFGGSYSGALTSWFRLKYPNLVDFTISSSAPVLAEVDFYQYLEVVQNSLLTTSKGQECVNNIASATQKIQTLLQTSDGLQKVSDLFDLCPPLATQDDISTFMQSLAGNFMGTVQYNLEAPGAATITNLCEIMTNPDNDPITNYVKVWQGFTDGCTDTSYETMIDLMKNNTNDASVEGGKMWFYQTCTEFGYYQSSDSTKQPFGNLIPIEYLTKQCQEVFGFNFTPNVEWTITKYGGINPDADNILYVNGDIDPWHALGITTPITRKSPSSSSILLIHGTSHCDDMLIPLPTSPPTLPAAQATIESYLTKWLTPSSNKNNNNNNNKKVVDPYKDMSEERLMEIEALSAIYMDSFKSINDDNIQITLLPNPSGEDNHVGVILDIKFTPEYPNEVPIIELIPTEKLTKDRIKELIQNIDCQAKENIGTSMIFMLAGTIKEWLDNNNTDGSVEEEEDNEESIESEEEEPVFEGTPVTVEAFLEWRKKFIAETQPIKKDLSKQGKITGRKLFEIDSSLILSDSKFMEEGEETSNISVAALKPKLEEVAAQVDWSLFGEEDLPDDDDFDEEDN
ncbi:hypothetical protein PPL_02477 [Heterostelium album PN500]|uniref:RWD domain-containing protein n=1 Tax=Heterostelium pallidum (strain ATCC 26659 / Pp 5 / PN500) TaxID=670386 RepID=D3B270_HETP5|nr:hypothetical protein PPL_02477 [Heterostelium album PN500]EFA84445.1 hypothetical protein PPL_02477 [Heterostelium album PN500]|eukprot:XP_020436559.1 hypothetical protein PPL_02477 [Heterostelium album PN500]